MSTVIKMADAKKISNYQIRLDAMDKIYQNDTEKMLRENIGDENSRKSHAIFRILEFVTVSKKVHNYILLSSSFS